MFHVGQFLIVIHRPKGSDLLLEDAALFAIAGTYAGRAAGPVAAECSDRVDTGRNKNYGTTRT